MRVLFLTLYPDIAASPRYRVTQFLPYLREHGVTCHVASALSPKQYSALTGPKRQGRAFWYHFAETPKRLRQILSARKYDIVFVQKGIMTAYLRGSLGLLRKCARRIVYDFDDAVHLEPPHALRFPWKALEDRDQIDNLIRRADLVLAGNAWLADVARKAGGKTEVFPTVVDTDRFVPREDAPEAFRIGWVGNPSTMVCLDPAAEALGQLGPGELSLVGADPRTVPWPKAEVRTWSLDTEVSDIQGFSLGIMPIPKGEWMKGRAEDWMKGKCALKALLYMACGVPCVATPFGAVLEFMEHCRNGLLADSTAQWRKAFDDLRDPAMRQRLGEAGRATVEERYALKSAAPRLLELLESIC